MRWNMYSLSILIVVAATRLIAPETTIAAEAPAGANAGAAAQPTTHRESNRVVLRNEKNNGSLQTFCIGSDGRLFGVVAKSYFDGARNSDGGEIRVLDAAGKETATWTTKFSPQRIAAAPDGAVYVGGSGRLLRFSADGKATAEVDSPHLKVVLADKEALRKAAEEQHAESVRQYEDQLKSFDEQVKSLTERLKKEDESKKKPAGTDDKKAEKKEAAKAETSVISLLLFSESGEEPSVKSQLEQYRQMQTMYKQMLDQQKKKSLEEVEREIAARLQRIHGIAASKDAVYVATAMAKGYGYAIWRMDRDFGNAKQIISGLAGCCGQIDVQARADDLFVAENARHRVVRYDREGKKLAAWGKRDRDGAAGGFGGCCNPMNLCFTGDGSVVTSESEGLMKRFSPDGTFAGLIGSAKVAGGCKNVAVAMSSDGKHAYFYDQDGSQIIVFDRADSAEDPKANAAKAKPIQ